MTSISILDVVTLVRLAERSRSVRAAMLRFEALLEVLADEMNAELEHTTDSLRGYCVRFYRAWHDARRSVVENRFRVAVSDHHNQVIERAAACLADILSQWKQVSSPSLVPNAPPATDLEKTLKSCASACHHWRARIEELSGVLGDLGERHERDIANALSERQR